MRQNYVVRSDSTTGYVGVYLDFRNGKFQAQCCVDSGQIISLGTYSTPEEAAIVVNECCRRIGKRPVNRLTDEQLETVKNLRATRRVESSHSIRNFKLKQARIRGVKGPEYKIQQAVIKYLEDRGWFVKVLTGTMYQWGLSDLLITHVRHGIKLVEIKNPQKFSFTPAQLMEFPKFIRNGAPIYVLTAANDENYRRLFKKSNLWIYLGGLNDGK